ncbi:hypothetical protein NLG97_g4414 [Lecanicillium saksenae]|uniref:Uncharacterized protein n=1 Tax=Lecanicillium saksenae TaxID=468837 RepID=A0ACC1QXZ5_9HYPO|nr:hypothetical protein NLG97_g4414 [Lecanicillium saksenae]
MSSHVLGDKDVNAPMEQQQTQDVKSMDYHRQVFQSKMAQEPYVYRKQTALASTSRATSKTAAASRSPSRLAARNTANSSDASSCSTTSSSSASPVPSLISDSSSTSASPTPSITVLPRFPTNKTFVASTKQYVSPSDNIMSPCTAKINALRNKHVSKAKPKSLFAQASAKKLSGENLFGSKSIPNA